MFGELSEEAQRHSEQGNWAEYRNVRYDTAQYIQEQGNRKRAGFLYLEVLIFDLQGVSSTPGDEGFHEAYRAATPAVVKELARFGLEYNLGEDEMKTIFDRVAHQTWMEAFPRAQEEVWAEIRETVQKEKVAIRLTEKVEALGPDQLLSEEEADAYIASKNEYEIIRRVEVLLENEDPAGIPREKADRVEKYLASLNPESLTDRWKAKVYRRGGDVMLSRGGRKKALEYFERALAAAGQEELEEVERIVEQLRPKLKA